MTLRDVIERAKAAGMSAYHDFDIVAGTDIVRVRFGDFAVAWTDLGVGGLDGLAVLDGPTRSATAVRLHIVDSINDSRGVTQ